MDIDLSDLLARAPAPNPVLFGTCIICGDNTTLDKTGICEYCACDDSYTAHNHGT